MSTKADFCLYFLKEEIIKNIQFEKGKEYPIELVRQDEEGIILLVQCQGVWIAVGNDSRMIYHSDIEEMVNEVKTMNKEELIDTINSLFGFGWIEEEDTTENSDVELIRQVAHDQVIYDSRAPFLFESEKKLSERLAKALRTEF